MAFSDELKKDLAVELSRKGGGSLSRVGRKHGVKVSELRGEVVGTHLSARLRGTARRDAEEIYQALRERALEGEFSSAKFLLEALDPEKFDAGVRKQREANRAYGLWEELEDVEVVDPFGETKENSS